MANATEVTTRVINLELTEDEAKTLHAMTYRVSGSPANTRRQHTQAIKVALDTVFGSSPSPNTDDITRGMEFAR